MDTEKLINIGGNEWIKNDFHRIYFNNLCDIVGLACSYFGTGNISSATLNGVIISNCRAKEIKSGLDTGKFWFDVNSGVFGSRYLYARRYDLHEMVIDGINNRLEN
ncbi:MAG: hypothetical protein H8E14_01160 [Candidatus Marinimicrobia bacterium]|nr:hypothetical protein [Candidatus Neomarinimicrobiota bacterium]